MHNLKPQPYIFHDTFSKGFHLEISIVATSEFEAYML